MTLQVQIQTCPVCNSSLPIKKYHAGQSFFYCNPACKQKAYRVRKRALNALNLIEKPLSKPKKVNDKCLEENIVNFPSLINLFESVNVQNDFFMTDLFSKLMR